MLDSLDPGGIEAWLVVLREGCGRGFGYYRLETIIVPLANFKCTRSGERMRQPACRTHPAFPDL